VTAQAGDELSNQPFPSPRSIRTASSTAPPVEIGIFSFEGRNLAYEIHGEGDRLLVYMHGLLLDAGVNRGIAQALAQRGNRVVLFDLLGHGRSDKPDHATEYRFDLYARDVFALLDHLGEDQAVLGGVSLGANVSLFAAVSAPERVRGLVLEMPVLEWAVPAGALLFVPIVLALHYATPVAAAFTRVMSSLPRTPFDPLNSLMDGLSMPPGKMAALLHGLLVGPIAPPADARRALDMPTLVLGHRHDLIHPLNDANNLVRELPNAHLVRARSPMELRMWPDRLTGEMADFLADIWTKDDAQMSSGRPRRKSGSGSA
jgi:pimeloyl-ACP methyl ester carboxylesterase